MTYSKGQYVTATANGGAYNVAGRGASAYTVGTELVITSIMQNGTLRVRKAAGGPVFTIAPSRVRAVRPLGEAPEGAIDMDDPRVQWIFEDAARIANRFGYCSTYDRLAEALGAPGRLRKFTIEIPAPGGVTVNATVQATSRAAAKKLVLASLTGESGQKALSA